MLRNPSAHDPEQNERRPAPSWDQLPRNIQTYDRSKVRRYQVEGRSFSLVTDPGTSGVWEVVLDAVRAYCDEQGLRLDVIPRKSITTLRVHSGPKPEAVKRNVQQAKSAFQRLQRMGLTVAEIEELLER